MNQGHHYFYTIDEEQWAHLIKDYCSNCSYSIPWSITRYKHRGNLCGPCNLKFHRAGIRRAARERELEENNPTDVV